jgi:cytochrome P450
LRNEVEPLFTEDSSDTTIELDKNWEGIPLLSALYHEALRVCTSSITVRNVVEDCKIGKTLLQKGSRVIIPYRQQMLNEKVFGEFPSEFNPNHFLQNPDLVKDPSFRPFGGGTSYCPGRFIAQKEILTLVAVLFGKLNVELCDMEQSFPAMETKKPCLGVMGPVAGDNLWVKLHRSPRPKPLL